ncbi:MAG: sigma 54-interacting transcriptional regulator, partial [Gemmatimonadaceae bacterium]
FTGAIKRVEGAFERAHRGTLLLDEISEMRLDLQAKLLRVLQEQEFERVGGTSSIRVDVRIVATTNRDLAAEAAKGTFRQDLYYRLSTIPIAIPPLRDRREDIPALAYRFAMRTAAEMNKEIKAIDPEALEVLQKYDWPGNVRELQHVVERAVILSTGSVVPPHAFEGFRFGLAHSLGGPVSAAQRASMAAADRARLPVYGNDDGVLVRLTSLNVEEAERKMIGKALEIAAHNRTRAAELLGISVRTLRNKLNGPTAGEASLTA